MSSFFFPPFYFNPLFCLSLLHSVSIGSYPLSFLSPTIFTQWQLELWQLFTFHFSPPRRENSRASGALFKQTGGRAVRRGWRHAITNRRLLAVAGAWFTGPRYGERGDLPSWLPRQPDSNISRGEVRSDGRWELMYWTTWSDRLTCTRWNHKSKKREGGTSILVRKITREANINRTRNEIRKRDKRWRNSVMIGCMERCVRSCNVNSLLWWYESGCVKAESS